MLNKKFTILAVAFALSCTGGIASYAQDNAYPHNDTSYQRNNANAVQPDNTQMNMRDRNTDRVTADQQKDNESDRTITQRIRRAIIGDKSLSTYAHNIKIISEGGAVTLKGPVRSTREKNVIIQKAVDVTGSTDKVTDQISIKRQK